MESRNGLHVITVLLLALRRTFSSLLVMASLGRFYVLGPPVQHANAVRDLVIYVMRRTPDLAAAPFALEGLEGPARFDSSWVPGGRSNTLRRGTDVADLWTGQVVWGTPTWATSFSVIVTDQNYLDEGKGQRRQKNQASKPSL